MDNFTRRHCIQGTVTALAGATMLPALTSRSSSAPQTSSKEAAKRGMKLAELFVPGQTHAMRLASQIGITHAVAGTRIALSQVRREQYVETLEKVKAEFQAAGLTIVGAESHPVPAEKIKLGLPGRDEEIENYKAAIEALSKVGIHMVCYNFMAGLGWYRTRMDLAGRGGRS